MVRDVPSGWRSYDDYLASLNGKYRHRSQPVNVLLRRVLRAVPHGEAPDRSPFKKDAGPGA